MSQPSTPALQAFERFKQTDAFTSYLRDAAVPSRQIEALWRAVAACFQIAAVPEMLAALGPLAEAKRKQAALLRYQAKNSTAGIARSLISTAEGWEKLCDAADAAIAKAERSPQQGEQP